MSLHCEIVKDLVSLYNDKEASGVSKEKIEKHLKTCNSCKKYYKEYKINTPTKTDFKYLGQDKFESLAKNLRMRRVWTMVWILLYVIASLTTVLILLLKRGKAKVI